MHTRSLFAKGVLLLAALACREDSLTPTDPSTTHQQDIAGTREALTFLQLSAGSAHTCGVTTEFRAYCWGNNNYGQLGNGSHTGPDECYSSSCSTRPVAVIGGKSFKTVTVNGNSSCGVTTDNRAYCWGSNASGQLGVGTLKGPDTCGTAGCSTKPTAVVGGRQFRQVNTGGLHTCGVTVDNRAFCWGLNDYGQLGNGTNSGEVICPGERPCTTRPVAVLGDRRFRQLSPGTRHTCGITTDSVAYCWGRDRWGELGDGSGTEPNTCFSDPCSTRPVKVAGGWRFRQLDAGYVHTCAVTPGNRAFCWGYGREGAIGDGTTSHRFTPRAVAGGLYFSRVTAGAAYTCGETTVNRAYCWGEGLAGQLGDGTRTSHLIPVAVVGGLTFGQLSAGGTHTCGKASAGLAYCWGDNIYGSLGDGTTSSRLRPTPVVSPT